jgi:hypothetical protein
MNEENLEVGPQFEGYMQRRNAKQNEIMQQMNDSRRMNGSPQIPIPPQVPSAVPAHLSMPMQPSQQHLATSPHIEHCMFCRNQGVLNCSMCNKLVCTQHLNADSSMCSDCQSHLDQEMAASLQKYDQEHAATADAPLLVPPPGAPTYDIRSGVEMITGSQPVVAPAIPAGNKKQICDYHLISMHTANRELWDMISQDDTFAHHFYEIVKMASGG